MPSSLPTTALRVALLSASRLLRVRLEALEQRIRAGEEAAWPDYLATVEAAATLDALLTPGALGEMLSTREMAAKLGVSSKTVLRKKKAGGLKPALAAGKLIRWKP